eukprot:gene6802-4882_t
MEGDPSTHCGETSPSARHERPPLATGVEEDDGPTAGPSTLPTTPPPSTTSLLQGAAGASSTTGPAASGSGGLLHSPAFVGGPSTIAVEQQQDAGNEVLRGRAEKEEDKGILVPPDAPPAASLIARTPLTPPSPGSTYSPNSANLHMHLQTRSPPPPSDAVPLPLVHRDISPPSTSIFPLHLPHSLHSTSPHSPGASSIATTSTNDAASPSRAIGKTIEGNGRSIVEAAGGATAPPPLPTPTREDGGPVSRDSSARGTSFPSPGTDDVPAVPPSPLSPHSKDLFHSPTRYRHGVVRGGRRNSSPVHCRPTHSKPATPLMGTTLSPHNGASAVNSSRLEAGGATNPRSFHAVEGSSADASSASAAPSGAAPAAGSPAAAAGGGGGGGGGGGPLPPAALPWYQNYYCLACHTAGLTLLDFLTGAHVHHQGLSLEEALIFTPSVLLQELHYATQAYYQNYQHQLHLSASRRAASMRPHAAASYRSPHLHAHRPRHGSPYSSSSGGLPTGVPTACGPTEDPGAEDDEDDFRAAALAEEQLELQRRQRTGWWGSASHTTAPPEVGEAEGGIDQRSETTPPTSSGGRGPPPRRGSHAPPNGSCHGSSTTASSTALPHLPPPPPPQAAADPALSPPERRRPSFTDPESLHQTQVYNATPSNSITSGAGLARQRPSSDGSSRPPQRRRRGTGGHRPGSPCTSGEGWCNSLPQQREVLHSELQQLWGWKAEIEHQIRDKQQRLSALRDLERRQRSRAKYIRLQRREAFADLLHQLQSAAEGLQKLVEEKHARRQQQTATEQEVRRSTGSVASNGGMFSLSPATSARRGNITSAASASPNTTPPPLGSRFAPPNPTSTSSAAANTLGHVPSNSSIDHATFHEHIRQQWNSQEELERLQKLLEQQLRAMAQQAEEEAAEEAAEAALRRREEAEDAEWLVGWGEEEQDDDDDDGATRLDASAIQNHTGGRSGARRSRAPFSTAAPLPPSANTAGRTTSTEGEKRGHDADETKEEGNDFPQPPSSSASTDTHPHQPEPLTNPQPDAAVAVEKEKAASSTPQHHPDGGAAPLLSPPRSRPAGGSPANTTQPSLDHAAAAGFNGPTLARLNSAARLVSPTIGLRSPRGSSSGSGAFSASHRHHHHHHTQHHSTEAAAAAYAVPPLHLLQTGEGGEGCPLSPAHQLTSPVPRGRENDDTSVGVSARGSQRRSGQGPAYWNEPEPHETPTQRTPHKSRSGGSAVASASTSGAVGGAQDAPAKTATPSRALRRQRLLAMAEEDARQLEDEVQQLCELNEAQRLLMEQQAEQLAAGPLPAAQLRPPTGTTPGSRLNSPIGSAAAYARSPGQQNLMINSCQAAVRRRRAAAVAAAVAAAARYPAAAAQISPRRVSSSTTSGVASPAATVDGSRGRWKLPKKYLRAPSSAFSFSHSANEGSTTTSGTGSSSYASCSSASSCSSSSSFTSRSSRGSPSDLIRADMDAEEEVEIDTKTSTEFSSLLRTPQVQQGSATFDSSSGPIEPSRAAPVARSRLSGVSSAGAGVAAARHDDHEAEEEAEAGADTGDEGEGVPVTPKRMAVSRTRRGLSAGGDADQPRETHKLRRRQADGKQNGIASASGAVKRQNMGFPLPSSASSSLSRERKAAADDTRHRRHHRSGAASEPPPEEEHHHRHHRRHHRESNPAVDPAAVGAGMMRRTTSGRYSRFRATPVTGTTTATASSASSYHARQRRHHDLPPTSAAAASRPASAVESGRMEHQSPSATTDRHGGGAVRKAVENMKMVVVHTMAQQQQQGPTASAGVDVAPPGGPSEIET